MSGSRNTIWSGFPSVTITGPVTITGTVNSYPVGLRNGGKVTEVPINSTTWTALPGTALAGRNAMSIQNESGIEVKVNYDATVVGYVGMKLRDKNERFYDITDAIVIYAKSLSGTPTLYVEELS